MCTTLRINHIKTKDRISTKKRTFDFKIQKKSGLLTITYKIAGNMNASLASQKAKIKLCQKVFKRIKNSI